jgi:hypothetical protein
MKFSFKILAIGVFVASWCWGQQPSSAAMNNVCRVYFVKPKPGATSQMEQGRQKHMQFHKRQNDTWTWNTWVIETGENTGNYVTSTCGHAWKDFDDWEKRLGKADAADADATMTPFEQSSTDSFYVYRGDLSLAAPSNSPAPMTAVTIFVLHPQTQPAFEDAVKKITAAINKQPDYPKTSGFLQLANGGEGPTYVLLSERKGWADYAPSGKTLLDVLTDSYGKDGAEAIFKTLRESVAHTFTETATYRADLSYTPSK